MIRKRILIFLILITLLSCDKMMPGGLWDKFETDLRIEKQSDQGPWGGTRAYYWRCETKGYFNEKRVFEFASSNGWNLIDSTKYKKEEINYQYNEGQPSFTVQAGPFEPSSDQNFLDQDFQRWTNSDLTLYTFKTGWLVFYPGTDNSTEVNGFITISDDGREMTVYHLWGE